MKSTIKDVAVKANVSVATVSRFLNSNGYVGKSSAEKIERAIAELDYQPSETARSLSTNKSKLIGFLSPDIENPFFSTVAKGIESAAQIEGYTVLIGNTGDSLVKSSEYIATFQANNVSGILSATGILHKESKMPIVYLDRRPKNAKYSVTADAVQGGDLIANRICASKNTQNICIISGPDEISEVSSKLGILRKRFSNQEYRVSEFPIDSFQVRDLEKNIHNCLEQNMDVDTFIASNDIYAMGLMSELQNRGKKVPEDVQVIGYDNISLAGLGFPKLTTVDQHPFEIGKRGFELLNSILETPNMEDEHVKLAVELIKGHSVR